MKTAVILWIVHSSIVWKDLRELSRGMENWWRLGWDTENKIVTKTKDVYFKL